MSLELKPEPKNKRLLKATTKVKMYSEKAHIKPWYQQHAKSRLTSTTTGRKEHEKKAAIKITSNS
jgi:hypothetical protein